MFNDAQRDEMKKWLSPEEQKELDASVQEETATEPPADATADAAPAEDLTPEAPTDAASDENQAPEAPPPAKQTASKQADAEPPKEAGAAKTPEALAAELEKARTIHENDKVALRTARYEARQQQQQYEKKLQELAAKVEALSKAPPPDPALDPDGYAQHEFKTLNERLKASEERMAAQTEEQRKAEEHQRLLDELTAHEAEYINVRPDYTEAVQFLFELRGKELLGAGHINPAARAAIIAQDVSRITNDALASGINAAQAFYDIAVARGYTHNPAASQPAPAQAPRGRSPAEAQARAVTRGQEEAINANRGDSVSTKDLTTSSLSGMSGEEISRLAREDPAKFRRVMGGG